MKKIMFLAALASVAACSQGEPAAEPEAMEEAVEAAPATTAADGGPSTGTFRVTYPDGSIYINEVKEDGTYTLTSEATGEVQTGTWVQKSPQLYCETNDEQGAVEQCLTEGIGEDGVWTSTGPDGNTVTIERVES